MTDVLEVNVATGKKTTRDFIQSEKDAIVAMQPTTDEKWITIRSQRDSLLRECDWWASSDRTLTDEQKTYRQNLRDLPASKSNPDEIVFPSKPYWVI